MHRLAAFAYRGRPPVEYLDQHLYEVSIHVYPFLLRKRISIKFAGVLAGVLHDIGKAVDAYQKCLLYDPETHACSYAGHEVFSALLATKIVDVDSIPIDVVRDLAEFLSCSEDEARRALMNIVIVSIMSHHQAMGSIHDRFWSFAYRVAKRRELKSVVIDRAIVKVVERALGEARRALRESYLYVEFDPRGVDYVEKLCSDAVKRGPRELVDRVLSEIKGSLAPRYSESFGEKMVLVERFVTGCLIAADIYVAGVHREGALDRPMHRYLERMYRYYSRYLPGSTSSSSL